MALLRLKLPIGDPVLCTVEGRYAAVLEGRYAAVLEDRYAAVLEGRYASVPEGRYEAVLKAVQLKLWPTPIFPIDQP